MREVEIRSFITEDDYQRLLERMKKEGEDGGKEKQVTIYFSGENDLRIQKSEESAKIWMKDGEIHEKAREEIEITIHKNEFEAVRRLFEALGHEVDIKWYRKRHRFHWDGLKVCIDHTPGYGRIVEVEKLTDEDGQEEALEEVKRALEKLGVEETPREKFDQRYRNYRKKWQDILRKKDLSEFDDI